MSLSTLLLAMLFCGLTAANTGVNVDTILGQYKESLQALWNMRNDRSVYVNQNDDACFDWYFEVIDENMNTYWRNSAQCDSIANGGIKSLNAEGANTRYDLEQRKRSICESLEFCEEKSDLLQFYDCYSIMSTNSTPVIYKLSGDSNNEYYTLLVKYLEVDKNKNTCDENVRDEYVQNSRHTDTQFQACRDGLWVPSPPTTVAPYDSTSTSYTGTYGIDDDVIDSVSEIK